MRKYMSFMASAAALLTLVSARPALSGDEIKSDVTPQPLVGHVQHKEQLSPVPSNLMKGAVFNDSELTALKPNNLWIPIPNWLAGTWKYKYESVTDMQNFTSNNWTPAPYRLKNESTKIFGQQIDKSGQIWHYLKAPYSYISKLDNHRRGYERVTYTTVESNSPTMLELKIGGTSTIVESNNTIFETDQSEEFHRYRKHSDKTFILDGSSKFFDMDGKATMRNASYMIATRSKPFAEIDEQDGEDLKQLFVEFMKTHGKGDLLTSSN